MKYFIQKEGVYYHGVYWIGESLEDGAAMTDELATNDKDDYHDWVLYIYSPQKNGDAVDANKEVYRGVRDD